MAEETADRTAKTFFSRKFEKLTRTSDPNRPTKGVLTLTDPKGVDFY